MLLCVLAVTISRLLKPCRSLKCGGVGLNLTASNHLVTMELAWSPATEKQAFDRIHRLGQTKECFIRRLVIENTVEQRILAIQSRKNDLSDGSLGEGNGKKMQRLSVKEIAALFVRSTGLLCLESA